MSCRRCWHRDEAHRHYRKGTQCALCSCPKLRRRRHWLHRYGPVLRNDTSTWLPGAHWLTRYRVCRSCSEVKVLKP